MTIKVGINGFGRIGRCTLSHIAASGRDDIQVVKLNATGPIETAAHLLKYDSVHGRFPGEVRIEDGYLNLGQNDIEVMSTYHLEELDWSFRPIWSEGLRASGSRRMTSIRSTAVSPSRMSAVPR